ncbi:MAG TPA: RIP metalloprotease RseP [Verrucomicrobiota bacterium]|nr:RIP metalloprotease RseP [Verrucomicrobiales bacterium]HRI12427.1 RIP metalloprotease RseP [Verrucomicrobiota bacterium]
MEPLTWLYVGGAVLLLFGASIFVHEYGHYWMARRRRMIVLGFAIGFGPKIFSWFRDGIEWSVRWIPAGGFVKLPQMITSEAIEGKASGDIPPASPWSRILVALAGPVMNLIFALAIACVIWVIGLPILVNPPVIGPVDATSTEGKLGVRGGDRIVEVNGHRVNSWQDINLEVITALTNVVPVTVERGGQRITFQLPTKRSEALGLKWLDLEPQERPIIGLVQPGMPAEKVGLKTGDKFLSFDGVYVLNQEHLSEVINKGQGRPCEVVVERDGKKLEFTVTPVFDAEAKRGRIGVGFAGGHYEVQRPGPNPIEQFSKVLNLMGKTFSALFHSKETGVTAKDMSGPVGILGKLAVDVNTDYRLALDFMVMLNINLALLNLLPLPVLDGGHILMALYELITRRRVGVRFQEVVTTGFAVLLISFMLYVTFYDIRRASLFGQLLRQKNVIEHPVATPEKASPTPP